MVSLVVIGPRGWGQWVVDCSEYVWREGAFMVVVMVRWGSVSVGCVIGEMSLLSSRYVLLIVFAWYAEAHVSHCGETPWM